MNNIQEQYEALCAHARDLERRYKAGETGLLNEMMMTAYTLADMEVEMRKGITYNPDDMVCYGIRR